MKYMILAILLMSSVSKANGFFSSQDGVFRNYALCDSSMTQDDKNYKRMYTTLKHDYENRQGSKIEVLDNSVYASELKDNSTGMSCLTLTHDNCYSVTCF